MTLEELKNYRLYCSELQEIKRELNGGTSEESSTGLLYRQKELEDKTKAMEQFVDSIHDYKIYRALRIYCIEPLDENAKSPDWEDVACRIGDGCSEGAIKMAVKRFFARYNDGNNK